MSAISQKSISGITSITTPAGVDNVFTVHTNDTTERFRVDLNGRVLIGTDTEGHANADDLTIATSGDTGITIRSGTTHNGRIYFSDATSGAGEVVGSLDYDHNNNKFSIHTDGGERLIIDSSGRLLLGTQTEGHPNADDLTIATSGDTGITIRSGTSNNGRIYFSDATSGTGEVVGSLDYDHNNDSFSIFTGGGLRLRIASDGKVGINETSPDRILHVRSDGVAAAKLGGESGEAYYMEIGQLASSGSPGFNATGSSASMLFQLNGSEKLRIKSNGNVGIGTNNPSQALDVNGKIKVFGSDGTAYGLVISPDSSGGTYEHLIAKMNGDLRIQAGSGTYQASNANILFKNSTKHILINAGNNGNVGINTNNPGTKLNVVGSIQAYSSVTGFVSLTSSGSIEIRRGDGGFIDFSTAASEDYDCRIKQTSSNDLFFETGGSGSTAERLRITSGGTLNIANVSSGNVINMGSSTVYANAAINIYRLGNGYADMRLSSNYGAKIALAGASDNTDEFFIQQDNQKNAYIYNEAAKGIIFGTSNTARFRILSGGDVVVNDTSADGNVHPDTKFHVKGGITFRELTSASETALPAITQWSTSGTGQDLAIGARSNNGAVLFFTGNAGTDGDWGNSSNAERLRIDSSGAAILKNTTAALPRSDFFGSLKPISQIASTWNAYHSITRHDAGSSYGPYLMLAKNRNDAYNSNGAVQDNDECGNIAFLGNDGTAFRESARIRGEVDGTPGSSQVPGAITFATNGGSGVVERLRITSNGELQLNGDTNKFVLPMYKGTFYCDANSYTKFATVTGNQLSSEIELTCHTTINAVVISSSFIIKAGHHQDFWIESRELKYTSLTIKCISNNNQNFDIYAKRNGGSYQSTQSNISFVIIPKNDETVTINNTVNYSGQSIVHSTQTGALKITGTGGVNCDINVAGSITGSSKNFSIEHPLTSLASTKKLVHASIEGPQCDLIYRGKIDLVGGTATVNIDIATGMSDGTFVKLNRDVQCFTSNETGWGAVKGSVSGNILTITAQDNSSTDTISWMVVGERQDDTIKSSSVTDDSGKLIVEPLTNEEPDNSHLHEFYPTS